MTITYTGNDHSGGFVQIYRTDLPGPPRLVKSFSDLVERPGRQWDGLITDAPRPQGTYLIGLRITDKACNTGFFPATIPPAPRLDAARRGDGALPGRAAAADAGPGRVDGDRVRRLRASARTAGRCASVGLEEGARARLGAPLRSGASRRRCRYACRRAGRAVRARGPLRVASHAWCRWSRRAVIPARSCWSCCRRSRWQGLNPVDDDHDGIPNTLANGGPIELQRPLANGLPPGFGDEAALIAYLDRSHLELRPHDRPRVGQRHRADSQRPPRRRAGRQRGVAADDATTRRCAPSAQRAGTCCRSGSTRCAAP